MESGQERGAQRHPYKVVLSWGREIRGWPAKVLAAKAGITPPMLSRLERDLEATPTREKLDELMGVMGFSREEVDRMLSWVVEAQGWPGTRGVQGPVAEVTRQSTERAVAEFAREVERFGHGLLDVLTRGGLATAERQRGELLWERIRSLTARQQRQAIEEKLDFRSWGLCVRLCEESIRAACDSADRAVELAELAVFLAGWLPGDQGWCERMLGWAWFHLGNARRVHGDLVSAGIAFAKAQKHWEAGEGADPGGILNPAQVLNLEASLRREQRRLSEAEELINLALTIDRGEIRPQLLTNRSKILEERREYAEALEVLAEARTLLTSQSEPRLVRIVETNYVWMLCHLERYQEAEVLLPGVQQMTLSSGAELDRVRLRWLQGTLAAGLGRRKEALGELETARGGFIVRGIGYDAALATLEIAGLRLEEGKTAEVKRLACEMVAIFQAQEVHREACAALQLFREAAERETVTQQLVRQLLDYLHSARHDPELRFTDFVR
jgi:tetratricopeptide (TPR) repeat protein